MVIDLRSDFISRPTSKMREEMMKASSAKCAFGLRESPIQKKLEQIAGWLQKPLFEQYPTNYLLCALDLQDIIIHSRAELTCIPLDFIFPGRLFSIY